ncbi:SIS domain-containing protein [Microbacterium sp. EST19A]|uniref:SIS domain-containing protein n=1 Tax=Microbacterium sp. EST19A TaxID=2862681 RepID=UPI001CC0E585|nr:SIS domain-containing protein [Microbacterium sp. EST19A]
MADRTPFEEDILEQPEALRRLAASAAFPAAGLGAVERAEQRIILTGMGSSHFAGIPTWRRLVTAGRPAWNVDAGQLLDAPGLLRTGSTLVATSQSGASGEVAELLERRAAGTLSFDQAIGIADAPDSLLAQGSDTFLPLLSGTEATVSTKSYLNTLGVHRLFSASVLGEDSLSVRAELLAAADLVEQAIIGVDTAELAASVAGHPRRRLAFVGRGDHAATALYSALITKESSKVAAEGYIGGQFRHGPFELAGDGLTVVLFGSRADEPDPSQRRLAEDLVASGSRVVFVGDDSVPGALTIEVDRGSDLTALLVDSVVAQLLAVELAKANGVVPGEFLFGSKITTVV